MEISDAVVAIFADHTGAEDAVKRLAGAGFAMKSLSVVGKGYHSEEHVVGFYSFGDRIKLWGSRGAFWGALWSLFFGGLFVGVPVLGPVVVLGYLATTMLTVVEGALVIGSFSVLGAAIYGIGIPAKSVLSYETAIKADAFVVMVHGTRAEVERARALLAPLNPARLDVHAELAHPAAPNSVAQV